MDVVLLLNSVSLDRRHGEASSTATWDLTRMTRVVGISQAPPAEATRCPGRASRPVLARSDAAELHVGRREPILEAGARELRARVGERGALGVGRGVGVVGLRQRTAAALADLD